MNNILKTISATDLYGICDFAATVSKTESGRYNTVLYKLAVMDALIITIFPETADLITGQDVLEASNTLREKGYVDQLYTEHLDLVDEVFSVAYEELYSMTSHDESTATVLGAMMDYFSKAFEGLSNKIDNSYDNEDVRSILNIAEKYGMK